jgi:hypothetical protein
VVSRRNQDFAASEDKMNVIGTEKLWEEMRREKAATDKKRSELPWPEMDILAYHGLAGDIVNAISPHSEADPIAILIQVLTFFGNLVGPAPYYQVEADRHHANLFTVLVGTSAKGRKGTSGGRARSVFSDEQWTTRIKGGLSSGEGLINEVRDEVCKWDAKNKTYEIIDPGVTDKRLMIVEPEFAGALAVMERPGNTLSPVLRNAWDGLVLSTITKNSPLRATGAHISITAHITEDELRARLTRTDAASGFGNRFLYPLVKRSKFLPFGGSLEESEIKILSARLEETIKSARVGKQITMTQGAREHWEAVYKDLSAAQSGLLGAVTARAEAQSVRLAMIYALIDGRTEIDVDHLKAALAIWEYCEASAARIFGQSLGDPVADEILRALQQAGANGLTRTAIRDLFGRHRTGDRIGAALALLMTNGHARAEERMTSGRPSEVWFAVGQG